MSGFFRTSLRVTATDCAGWKAEGLSLCPVQLLACVIKKNWRDLVCACSLKNWKEALALLLTYSGPEKFPELCGTCDSHTWQQTYARRRQGSISLDPGGGAQSGDRDGSLSFPGVSRCSLFRCHICGKSFAFLCRARLI